MERGPNYEDKHDEINVFGNRYARIDEVCPDFVNHTSYLSKGQERRYLIIQYDFLKSHKEKDHLGG